MIQGKWYLDYLTFMIFGVLMIVFFITGIIKWKRFEYWFEDDELRIEYGLFVKKKRYIPFDRIQSLDYTEGILHRPFKLVKVKVETAGGSTSKKAEAELTAITKEAAELIEREIADAKSGKRSFAGGRWGRYGRVFDRGGTTSETDFYDVGKRSCLFWRRLRVESASSFPGRRSFYLSLRN